MIFYSAIFYAATFCCWLRARVRRAANLCGDCAAPLDMCLNCKLHDYAVFDPDKTRYCWPLAGGGA